MLDPIADMLTRIRNALAARHAVVRVPHSKVKEAIGQLLVQEGYVAQCDVSGEIPRKELVIHLKYDARNVPAIKSLKRVSRSGRRVYSSVDDLKPVFNGLGTAVLSTSKGILTDKQARRLRVGGEVLCEIW